MGLKLSPCRYRAWARLIVVFMVCSLAHGSAFGSSTVQQQAEKTNQEKQEPKPVATSEKKASEQAGDSESQPADPTSVERQEASANDSGAGSVTLSRIKSAAKSEFKPMVSSLKPWGVTSPQTTAEPGRLPSFSLYFMSEYRRDEIKYTGKPSLALQFPSPVPPFSVPDAPIFFVPSAFEPNDEQFVSYLSATFKDFGIGRLRMNTHVSLRYSADLDGSTEASPFLGIRDNFVGRRIFEPLTFFTDIKGFVSGESESRLSLRVGRQYVYGVTPLRVDGATLSINHPRFSLDVFGGRRATFYSDPAERGVVGENFAFRATEQTTIRYDFVHYINNVHNLEVRHLLGESWILNGSLFLIDADPVDLNLGATYVSPGARTRLTVNVLQKLTSNDFIYDQTYRALAQNPENQFRRRFFPLPPDGQVVDARGRLNLGLVNPYTQFYIDGYRNLTQKVGVGGTVWVRKVNSREDEGPFDNSFQEYRVNADYFPSAAVEVGAEYRFRHLSRENPERALLFNDIGREGEKIFHEVYTTATYNFPGNRLSLEGGLFYRRFDTQSRLISLEGMDTYGYTAGARWRVARDYKLSFEYGFDRELAFLNPDIDYTQGFRVRFEWRFSQ
ncbi:MAG: hypothetical protein AABN33_26160 [Acidobacteriota bacterium]